MGRENNKFMNHDIKKTLQGSTARDKEALFSYLRSVCRYKVFIHLKMNIREH